LSKKPNYPICTYLTPKIVHVCNYTKIRKIDSTKIQRDLELGTASIVDYIIALYSIICLGFNGSWAAFKFKCKSFAFADDDLK
jgi:hypothetical protein